MEQCLHFESTFFSDLAGSSSSSGPRTPPSFRQLKNFLAGLRRAKAAGKVLGRPTANVRLARVQELRQRGLSLREIADKTGVSTMTAQRLLKRGGAAAVR